MSAVGGADEGSRQEFPTWLHQMPTEEVLCLARGGSELAARYVAWCEVLEHTAREEGAGRSGCGHDPESNFFDRTLCAEPCGKMHTCCRECGRVLDGCAHEGAASTSGQ